MYEHIAVWLDETSGGSAKARWIVSGEGRSSDTIATYPANNKAGAIARGQKEAEKRGLPLMVER